MMLAEFSQRPVPHEMIVVIGPGKTRLLVSGQDAVTVPTTLVFDLAGLLQAAEQDGRTPDFPTRNLYVFIDRDASMPMEQIMHLTMNPVPGYTINLNG